MNPKWHVIDIQRPLAEGGGDAATSHDKINASGASMVPPPVPSSFYTSSPSSFWFTLCVGPGGTSRLQREIQKREVQFMY